MSLLQLSSPHARGRPRTSRIMLWVMLLTLPGLIAQTLWFGWGNLINVVLCVTVAIGAEAIILRLRQRPVRFFISDNTAAVTGLLLGLSLPSLAPWWISVVAVVAAIVLAKQLYGGLGSNPFNPAMVGYALVLISFPVALTTNWASPTGLMDDATPGFMDTLALIFGGADKVDGFTMATPLDVYKHDITSGLASQVVQNPVFGDLAAKGWEWVNLAFLAGGLGLMALRLITWHIPVSVLAGLSIMSLIFGWDADLYAPLSLHLLAGATMLGAFVIATDPVTAATSHRGKLIYGAGIGILLYIIRTWGSYPDAIAFAVLLMNFAVPFIDHYTQPRTYGHSRARRIKVSNQ